VTVHQRPGVYLEQVLEPPPLDLRTGVPAFVGYADAGPPGVGELLPSAGRFDAIYGPGPADGYLAAAVNGFFQNGGELCRVVRLDGTVDELRHALQALESVDDVDLVCAPDLTRPIEGAARSADAVIRDQIAVRDHCDRLWQRLAILDAPPGGSASDALAARGRLASPNGALYYPWLVVAGGRRVPPCGHVAGVYARCDAATGPQQAPANEVVEGVVDLEVQVSDAEQAGLDPNGVNCIRALPGRGIRIYGARTLSTEPAWSYVPVRRVATTFARRAEGYMAAFVFEPNDPSLWARARRELTAECEDLWRHGALAGAAPDEAFFVHCDAETNTPADRDAGRLVAVVGLAVVSPASFVIVRVVGEAARR
jgi:phage tail sheath protein FI